MSLRSLGIAAAVSLAASAAGQSTTSGSEITFALHWRDTGNHNGILEPGEGALLSLDVSFTNQFTVATFAPPIGTFGSGTIRGLGSGFLDLTGSANNGGDASGDWNVNQSQGYGVNFDWDVTGGMGNGAPNLGGTVLHDLEFGQWLKQFPIVTTNPIQEIWRGVWTPSSLALRTVSFTIGSATNSGGLTASLAFRLSASGLARVYVPPENLHFGSVQIPIVPGPASLTLLVIAPLARRGDRQRSVT